MKGNILAKITAFIPTLPGRLLKLLGHVLQATVVPWVAENGKKYIKPLRVVNTVFIGLIIWAVIDKIQHPDRLSDTFVLGMFAQTSAFLAIDAWRSNSKDKHSNKSQPSSPEGTGV